MEDELNAEPGYTPEQIEKKTKLFRDRDPEFPYGPEHAMPLIKLVRKLVYEHTTIDEQGCVTTADLHEVCNQLANSKLLQKICLEHVYQHEQAWIHAEYVEKITAQDKLFKLAAEEIEKSEYAPD